MLMQFPPMGVCDLKYPKATGEAGPRNAIADCVNTRCAAGISPDNVAIFAGGRPGIDNDMKILSRCV